MEAVEIGVLMMVLKVRYRINQIIGDGRNNLSKTRTMIGGAPLAEAYAWASRSRPEMPSDCANALNSLAGISLTTLLVSGLIS